MNSRIQELQNIMKGVTGRVTSAASSGASSFSMPTFNTLKTMGNSEMGTYAAYTLLVIAAFITLILFLEAIGMNIIRARPGAPGILSNPFSSGDSTRIKTIDTASVSLLSNRVADPAIFTLSTVLQVKQRAAAGWPELLLHYGSADKKDMLPSGPMENANVTTLFSSENPHPFQFALWLDGRLNMLYVQFYNKEYRAGAAASAAAPPLGIVTLENPPLDTPFRVSIVFQSRIAEVYVGKKLVKTIVTNESISPYSSPAAARFYIPPSTTNTSVKEVTVWNAPLTYSEIAAID